MPDREPRKIDWASAEVHDGTLTVELTGRSAKAWSKQFEGVLRLLEQGNGGWREISLHKKSIEVTAVRTGSEDELRHLLESLVLQVNSDLGAELDEPTAEPPHDDPQRATDDELAATFRSFAQAER